MGINKADWVHGTKFRYNRFQGGFPFRYTSGQISNKGIHLAVKMELVLFNYLWIWFNESELKEIPVVAGKSGHSAERYTNTLFMQQ